MVSKEELAKALEELLSVTEASTDIKMVSAVYHTPAESLRLQAQALEHKDAIIARARYVHGCYKNGTPTAVATSVPSDFVLVGDPYVGQGGSGGVVTYRPGTGQST
jgi:hypothetical protein